MSNVLPAAKRRACVACTTAKAKCSPETANLCQRCSRMGKPCVYLDMPQTRRKPKSRPKRADGLEKKVDRLASQLAALTRQSGHGESPEVSNLRDRDSSSIAVAESAASIASLLESADEQSHGLNLPTRSILEGQSSIVDRGLLGEEDAELLIKSFRYDFGLKFPFVVLAHAETAASLVACQPFLFLCIVAATMSMAHPLRRTVTNEVMQHVMLRVVARSERNLELLKGLLVYCAWFTYPAQKGHPQLLLLVQFCVSILFDLGLYRKPNLSADEQRALLGTYWLSAGLSGALGHPVSMKHDKRIDECLESIVASAEHISDRWIEPFVQLVSFGAKLEEAYNSTQATGGVALLQITRGALKRQFHSMMPSIEKVISNCPLPTKNAIRTEVKYLEIRLEEVCLKEELWVTEPTSTIRTTMLMDLIIRCKELIQATTNLPHIELAQISISNSARLCAAIGVMPTAVLTLLQLFARHPIDPSWPAEAGAIVDAADYSNVVESLVMALETKVEGMSEDDKEADITGSLCSKMRLLARSYPYRVRAIVDIGQPEDRIEKTASTNSILVNQTPVIDGQMGPSPYNSADDAFSLDDMEWASLLGEFNGSSWNTQEPA